jgi:hypothetical protein
MSRVAFRGDHEDRRTRYPITSRRGRSTSQKRPATVRAVVLRGQPRAVDCALTAASKATPGAMSEGAQRTCYLR